MSGAMPIHIPVLAPKLHGDSDLQTGSDSSYLTTKSLSYGIPSRWTTNCNCNLDVKIFQTRANRMVSGLHIHLIETRQPCSLFVHCSHTYSTSKCTIRDPKRYQKILFGHQGMVSSKSLQIVIYETGERPFWKG